MAIKLLNADVVSEKENVESAERAKDSHDVQVITSKLKMKKLTILSSLSPHPLFSGDMSLGNHLHMTKEQKNKKKKNKVRAKIAKESKRRNRGNR